MKRRTFKQLRSKLESLDHHNVYVVLLDSAVGRLKKVRTGNPKRDPKKPWRDTFFYEHLYTHAPKPPRHIEPSEGVRTCDWKYIVWLDQTGPAREELYDLRNDPLEMKNLAATPAAAAKLSELRCKHETFRKSLK